MLLLYRLKPTYPYPGEGGGRWCIDTVGMRGKIADDTYIIKLDTPLFSLKINFQNDFVFKRKLKRTFCQQLHWKRVDILKNQPVYTNIFVYSSMVCIVQELVHFLLSALSSPTQVATGGSCVQGLCKYNK